MPGLQGVVGLAIVHDWSALRLRFGRQLKYRENRPSWRPGGCYGQSSAHEPADRVAAPGALPFHGRRIEGLPLHFSVGADDEPSGGKILTDKAQRETWLQEDGGLRQDGKELLIEVGKVGRAFEEHLVLGRFFPCGRQVRP